MSDKVKLVIMVLLILAAIVAAINMVPAEKTGSAVAAIAVVVSAVIVARLTGALD